MDKQFLGDYELVKQIGKGTLGSVYLAEHRFIKRPFILKILPEELAEDRGFVQRFEKEAATLASLDHPHIVKTHNVSYSEGYYFLVSDCIVDPFGETTNLAQHLSVHKQTLNENEILDLLTQVASALDYAHKKEVQGHPIVHRGMKLNNILLGKGERGLHIYLSDFSLARIIGEGAILSRTYQVLSEILSLDEGVNKGADKYFSGQVDSSKLSKLHASFLQTYAFLAPEQKVFRDTPVGPPCDVYAFGVLVYFLIMRSYPEGFFTLPSQAYPDYRLNWDLLLYQCLQPEPGKRPISLSRVIEELVNPQSYNPTTQRHVKEWVDAKEQKEGETLSQEGTLFEGKPQTAVALEEAPREIRDTKMLQKVSNLIKESQPKPILKPQEISRPVYDPDPGAIFQIESTVTHYKPKEKEVKNVEPIMTEMVVINGSEFYRGSNDGGRDERPLHKIKLSDFAIDVHSVTNEQFVRFLEAMGGEKDANNQDIIQLKDSRIKQYSGKYLIESGYSKHPVVGVTWYGAIAYAKWVGKRLPTEAEWEIASKGGVNDTVYPTGNNIERTQANFFSSDTTAVKSYPPNGYGLYDMPGNVYEWCQDWYQFDYYDESMQEPENPQGPVQGVYRVLRGGCWKSLKEDLRISHRHRNNPGTVNRTYGFRCATDVS